MAHAALGIECPTCTVPVGVECITVQFDAPKPRPPHASRLAAARGQGLGKFRSTAEKRVAPALPDTLAPDYPGPFLCDYVLFAKVEVTGEGRMKTFGHTGRVLGIEGEHGEKIQVRPTPTLGVDIPWDGHHENDLVVGGQDLEGWWPESQTEPRSTKNMRKVNRWN